MNGKKTDSYLESVHRDGRIWGICICILLLMFPVAVCLIFKTIPTWDALFKGLFATLPMYWAVGIV